MAITALCSSAILSVPMHTYNLHKIVRCLRVLFQISQSNDKKGNPNNPDLDFLIEIHPDDGFLGGEVHFRISCSIGKSGFRFSKSKSGFPNQMHP